MQARRGLGLQRLLRQAVGGNAAARYFSLGIALAAVGVEDPAIQPCAGFGEFAVGLVGKVAVERQLPRQGFGQPIYTNIIYPFDKNPPLSPSGIRVGSPALTTRGFTAAEMRTVGALIAEVLDAVAAHGLEGAEPAIHAVRAKVGQLTDLHPLYDWKLARA